MTYGFTIAISAGLCALSALAMRHDRVSRFVMPYLAYGLVTDLSFLALEPRINALRPAHGPMRGLGVWLVGLNQWQYVTDPWVLLVVCALAFGRKRIAALGSLIGAMFFALAMSVYHWVRAGYPDRSFDAVLRVDAVSEMLGACAALAMLVMIFHHGLRGERPQPVGVGHFVMLMYAASVPVISVVAYMAPTPDYDARTAGLVIAQCVCISAYLAAFAYKRFAPETRLFVAR